MKVDRVFNNNIIRVMDGGTETILTGLGLGFRMRPGDVVDESKVEKRFVLEPEAGGSIVGALVADLAYEVLQLADALATTAHERLGVELTPRVHFALADHLSAALERSRAGQRIENPLLWEVRSAYPTEFAVALEMLDQVSAHAHVTLPLDEAGYLTMHLVNATLTGNMEATLRASETVREIIAIVARRVGIAAAPQSNDFLRFVTHVKYFVQRLEDAAPLSGAHAEVYEMLRASDEEVSAAAMEVAEYATDRYGGEVTSEELLYLMLHIHRVRRARPAAPGSGKPISTIDNG
ncbi:PRD domain-containing protein [Streptomyces sp. NP160]|uniref:PRD domain-containing protein n=1 Tax=Streptomyces sp. NP160 TaxID=2586637 RepID=UPI0015D5B909|nr:PRD domain-containing protein [Streptomyces sp. NP160]